MAKSRKWTKEEDQILAILVRSNQDNKQIAFKEASTRIERSVSACQDRWYKCLNNPEHPSYVGDRFYGIETPEETEDINSYTADVRQKVSIFKKFCIWIKSLFKHN